MNTVELALNTPETPEKSSDMILALELASESVIFHEKLTEKDQIINLTLSRALPLPPSGRNLNWEIAILGPKIKDSPRAL